MFDKNGNLRRSAVLSFTSTASVIKPIFPIVALSRCLDVNLEFHASHQKEPDERARYFVATLYNLSASQVRSGLSK